MPYPNFRAGQRVTAALLNAGKPEYTMTSGAQTNATTTVADVLGMGFWAIKNALYLCQVWVSYDVPAGNDAKFQWWSNNGVMERNIIALALSATTNIASDVQLIRNAATTPRPVGGTGGTANAFSLYQETSILHTVGTDGWVTLQYGVQTAGGTVTVQDSSLLIYTQLA